MTEHVLDANVFIHTADLNVRFEDAVTVPAVVEELESRDASVRYDLSGVDVYEPGEEALETVGGKVEELGEELSPADMELVALALDRGSLLVTDDYGMQNVASALGVEYEAFQQDGIEEEIVWKTVCENCGAEVDGDRCERCGGGPKRVPRE